MNRSEREKQRWQALEHSIQQQKQRFLTQSTQVDVFCKWVGDFKSRRAAAQHRVIWHRAWELFSRKQQKLEQELEQASTKLGDYTECVTVSTGSQEWMQTVQSTLLELKQTQGHRQSSTLVQSTFRELRQLLMNKLEQDTQLMDRLDEGVGEKTPKDVGAALLERGRKDTAAYLQDMAVYSCIDEELKQSMMDEFQVFCEQYLVELEALSQTTVKGKPLKPRDEFRVRKLMDEYHGDMHQRALVYDRIAMELPLWNNKDIRRAVEWMEQRGLLIEKLESKCMAFDRLRQEYKQRILVLFQEANREDQKSQKSQMERERWMKLQQEKKSALIAWRNLKQQELEMEQEHKRQQRLKEQQQLAAKLDVERNRREEEKQSIQMHRDKKSLERSLILKQQALEQERLRAETQEQLKWIRGRVSKRREIVRGKVEEGKRKQQMKLEQQAKIAAILEKLRASVAVIADRDPERLRMDTESIQHAKQADRQKLLFPVHSYDDQTVFKDLRSKVSSVLHQNGLLDSGYARQLIARLPPATKPRPDMFVTEPLIHQ